MSDYYPPVFKQKAFSCPYCNVLASQTWSEHIDSRFTHRPPGSHQSEVTSYRWENYHSALCGNCRDVSIWKNSILVYPLKSTIDNPNPDLPADVIEIVNEAISIFNNSPRGATALLRLALQTLCGHIGEKGENINQDIKNLVSRGLPETVQRALDSIRVVGNNAVHPGLIDINDNPEIGRAMFHLLNIICNHFITEPKKINEAYNFLPEKDRLNIAKRDGGSATT